MLKAKFRVLCILLGMVGAVLTSAGCAVGSEPFNSPLSPLATVRPGSKLMRESPLSPLATSSPAGAQPAVKNSPCPDGCVEMREACKIKGVVTAAGEKYYYTSDMSGYDKQPMSTEKGARWFCTVDEAIRKGFQRPRAP